MNDVVGFRGWPVQGGVGLKPPVFVTPEDRYSVDDPAEDARTFSREEAAEYRERGHLTLTSRRWPIISDGIVVYAHAAFLRTDERRAQLDLHGLSWDNDARVYLDYRTRFEAFAVLDRWGKDLLNDAATALQERDHRRALDSSERARLCAPLPQHRDLRIAAFKHASAAWQQLDIEAWQRFLRDAARDFDAETVERIRAAATETVPSKRRLLPRYRIPEARP
jgi:hypothetical protein